MSQRGVCQFFVAVVLSFSLAACGVAGHNGVDEGELLETINTLGEAELEEACGPDEALAAALIEGRELEGGFEELAEVEAVAIDVQEAALFDETGGPLCTWYLWLVDHHASKALQYGMWGNVAMASWHSYWAEFYQGVADSVCEEL